MPSNLTSTLWRRVCVKIPLRASIRMTLRSAVDAPVTMLRVYCSCPGVSATMKLRFFSTEKRNFIVADTPGHEQYTRNMVTGASTANLSIILIDARKGVLTQTRRHSFLVWLLGIRHVVLVVNKMDLVDYSQEVFTKIEADYRAFATELGLPDITCIPISAVKGDNISSARRAMPWYQGPTLMGLLDNVEIDETRVREQPLRLPIQWVNRPDQDFRGFAGTIVGGRLRKGDAIRVQPSGRTSKVARIVTFDGDLEEAVAGQSITITLADEIDVSPRRSHRRRQPARRGRPTSSRPPSSG